MGVLVACPALRDVKDEIEDPMQIDGNLDDWRLKVAKKHTSKIESDHCHNFYFL